MFLTGNPFFLTQLNERRVQYALVFFLTQFLLLKVMPNSAMNPIESSHDLFLLSAMVLQQL